MPKTTAFPDPKNGNFIRYFRTPNDTSAGHKSRFHIYIFGICAKIRLAGRMAKPEGLFSIVNAL